MNKNIFYGLLLVATVSKNVQKLLIYNIINSFKFEIPSLEEINLENVTNLDNLENIINNELDFKNLKEN